jgi:hypothetical protein
MAQQTIRGANLGKEIYLVYCSSCNAEDATSVAPEHIRGLARSTFDRALRGIERMPELDHVTAEAI